MDTLTQGGLFAGAAGPAPTYRVSTWHGDPEDVAAGGAANGGMPPGTCGCPDPDCRGGWHLDYSGLRLWRLRPHIRHLRCCGYDRPSILVEREPPLTGRRMTDSVWCNFGEGVRP